MTHLVVDRVELSEDDAVDEPRAACLGEVRQALVEVVELVHAVVAHKSLQERVE